MSESSGEEFFEAPESADHSSDNVRMLKSSTFPRRSLELDISSSTFASPDLFHTPSSARLSVETSSAGVSSKPSPSRSSISPDAINSATGFDRRSKLQGLRSRLRQELEDSEFDGSVRQSSSLSVLPIESTASANCLSTESDKMSLASWSKDLLQRQLFDSSSGNRKVSVMSEEDFVMPADTISTKGEYANLPLSLQPYPLPDQPPMFVLPPPPSHTVSNTSALPSFAVSNRLVTSSSLEEAKSSSSGSKSSTLDRQASFGSGGLLLGSGIRVGGAPNDSLASIVSDFGSGLSSKSNSLNRDAASGYDETALALLERRNSEAAEIIDALACEVVPEAVAASLSNERLPDLPEEPECSPVFHPGNSSTLDPPTDTQSFESPCSSYSLTPSSKMSPSASASCSSAVRLSSSSSLRSALDTPCAGVTSAAWATPCGSSSSCSRIGPPVLAGCGPTGSVLRFPQHSAEAIHHSNSFGSPVVVVARQPDVVASCSVAPDCPIPPPRKKKLTSSVGSESGSGGTTPIMRDIDSPDGRPLSVPIFDSPKLARVDSHSRRLPNIHSVLNVSKDSNLESDRMLNPLSLHMMRLTAQMDQNTDHTSVESDGGSDISELSAKPGSKDYLNNARNITTKYRRFLGRTVGQTFRKTASRLRKVSDYYKSDKDEQALGSDEEEMSSDAGKVIQVRASHHNKGPYDFDQVRLAQDLSGEHSGPIWCVKFSLCGRLMATAGQDNLIRIWVLKDAFDYFNDMRIKYNADSGDDNASSPGMHSASSLSGMPIGHGAHFGRHEPSMEPSSSSSSSRADTDSFAAGSSAEFGSGRSAKAQPHPAPPGGVSRGESFASFASSEIGSAVSGPATLDEMWWPFRQQVFCFYRGHTADVLDVAWSKNYFLLSSSMDRTVRLWHISRDECLCCFQHIDFVTAIAFLPRDDRYFLSGCLDGKLRLWNIPEKKVALWNEIDNGTLITAMTFVKSGKYAVVGTFDGRCIFYSTDHLKYFTQIDIKSSRRKNAKARKIMGLEATADKLLVTSNDSRIRLFDLTDLSLTCKYKGCSNGSSQIKASFSPNGKHIVCGSEDKGIFLWRTLLDSLPLSVRKDRNRLWEAIKVHNAVVTAAVFAPKPELIFKQIDDARRRSGEEVTSLAIPLDMMNDSLSRISISSQMSSFRRPSSARTAKPSIGDVLVSADFTGALLVFINKPKVKTGSSIFLPSY